MDQSKITTENTVFVILSFEGPDSYSLAGGLGVRVTNLSQSLARCGFTSHFFFIGDPKLKGEEVCPGGKLIHHRWCQWISQYYPLGVYQGQNEKLRDFTSSIPPFILDHIIKPAISQQKMVVVLAEEWQTAAAICQLGQLLQAQGLRDRVILSWNANNTFGFDRINWKQLNKTATITTVSRYMKHMMWRLGLNPLVIPNGIPRSLLTRVDSNLAGQLKESLKTDLLLTKIARWDPDKRWNMAVEATARLKARNIRTVLLARGGMESYGEEVLYNARSLGLIVKEVTTTENTMESFLHCLAESPADVINIKFHCPQDFLRIVYRAADAVLANSGREPFGLVGLETMAAGGIAFTGSTGEDYAISFHNSIVLETADPKEIESNLLYLQEHEEEGEKIRKNARSTALCFTWEQILDNLIHKLEYQARI